jgi:hypothetical protein
VPATMLDVPAPHLHAACAVLDYLPRFASINGHLPRTCCTTAIQRPPFHNSARPHRSCHTCFMSPRIRWAVSPTGKPMCYSAMIQAD